MITKRQIKSVSFLDLKDKQEQSGYLLGALVFLSYFLVIITFPLSLCFCLKVCIYKHRYNILSRIKNFFHLKSIIGCTRI